MQNILGNHEEFDRVVTRRWVKVRAEQSFGDLWSSKPKTMSINHLRQLFTKIRLTLNTNTSQIQKITPSWSTVRKSVDVDEIYTISLYYFAPLFLLFFLFFLLILFFFQEEGLWQEKLCTF